MMKKPKVKISLIRTFATHEPIEIRIFFKLFICEEPLSALFLRFLLL